MKLTTSCIITDDVQKLSSFYREVLNIEPQSYGPDYVEFETDQGILAIYHLGEHEKMAPGSARSGANESIILEFNVDEVDKEYKRLNSMDISFAKHPTTQPWGTRSFYFYDPDGNLINFYTHTG